MDITLQAQILSLRAAVESTITAERDLVRQVPTPEARWSPGDQMTARVEAALPGGRFHVRVDDLLLEMHLPAGFEPGDQLDLEFISSQPRPSFLLRDAPDVAGRSVVDLSRSSRELGQLVKSVLPERTTLPSPVKAAQPILPEPALDVPRLAQALATALSRSGLFYESHQAEWLMGQRPLEELLQEPQGRLAAVTTAPGDGVAGAPADSEAGVGARDLAPARDHSVTPGQLGDLSTNAGAPAKADPEPSGALAGSQVASTLHPQSLPQVRSQLETLETGQVTWQGQLWPGQELEWTLRDPGDGATSSLDDPQPWFTELRLRLPRLGALTAGLALVGPALRVRLTASDPAAESAMSDGRVALARALGEAGIDLVSFNVVRSGAD
ncbi:MAG TPA: flagellar hook-length control protein FliK [Burkholderiales bacterium]|nr:flagellar hook-length control protein FliK [Burkholderiales bacterium]